MMVSIIIATYMMGDTLERCIRSCLAQKYKDIEIVVVDDGSPLESGDKMAVMNCMAADEGNKIKYFYQEHKGHSAARNTGLENAMGNLLYFADADDYIHPSTIQILTDNLTATDSDISIGGTTRKDLQLGGLINSRMIFEPAEALKVVTEYSGGVFENPLKVPFLATWNKVFDKKLFESIRFPTGKTHDDVFTVHRLLTECKRVVYTPAETYRHTYKEHSISNDGLYSNFDMIQAYWDRVLFFKDKEMTEYLPDTLAKLLFVCIKTYENTGNESALTFGYNATQEDSDNQQMVLSHRLGKLHYKKINEMLKNE